MKSNTAKRELLWGQDEKISRERSFELRALNEDSSQKRGFDSSRLSQIPFSATLPHEVSLGDDLTRIVKLVANTLEAHSAFLLLPAELRSQSTLLPLSTHTLSPKAVVGARGTSSGSAERTPITSGPLFWVARTGKSLQVSPFDRDSRILGVYSERVDIKSLAGVPVKLPRLGSSTSSESSLAGVLAVDSLKSYRFTQLQIKILSELATQIERILELHLKNQAVETEATPTNLEGLPERRRKEDASAKAFALRARALSRRYRENELSLTHVELNRQSIIASHFPAENLLSAQERVGEAWSRALSDIQEQSLGSDETERHSQALYAPIVTGDSICFLCDHLRTPFIINQLKAFFSHHLKRLLQYLAADPRPEFFDQLAEGAMRKISAPLSSVLGSSADKTRPATTRDANNEASHGQDATFPAIPSSWIANSFERNKIDFRVAEAKKAARTRNKLGNKLKKKSPVKRRTIAINATSADSTLSHTALMSHKDKVNGYPSLIGSSTQER